MTEAALGGGVVQQILFFPFCINRFLHFIGSINFHLTTLENDIGLHETSWETLQGNVLQLGKFRLAAGAGLLQRERRQRWQLEECRQ